MSPWEWIFWLSAGIVVYTYVGYPVLIWGLSRLRFSPTATSPATDEVCDWPFVSIIIAAYKEETVIIPRLLNATLLDYPHDNFEIIVGVDGHEDCTGELVRDFPDDRVRLVQYPVRRGKASVLNDTVPLARGKFLVFSDANTMMKPDALKQLMRHFERDEVGCVCGKLDLIDSANGQNVDGAYWKYENFLKNCESRAGALLGVNGGIYALRCELYEPIPTNTIVDDFLIGMRVHLMRRKLIYETAAVALEETPETIPQEFRRRSRIGAGGIQSLQWLWPLLSPTRGTIALAFWSHKVLRWFCPVFLLAALVTNLVLMNQPLYQGILWAQAAFYGLAALGTWCFTGSQLPRLLRLPAMFVNMNVALLIGTFRAMRGIRSGTWKRTERTQPLEAVTK